MKIIKFLLLFLIGITSQIFAALPVIEPFNDSNIQNTWEQFWTTSAVLEAVSAGTDGIPDSPKGDGWFGRSTVTTTAASSSGHVTGDFSDTNYTLQAYIYTPVVNTDSGPDAYWYQMLVFYRQTDTGNYGRFHTQFNTFGGAIPAPRIRCQVAPSPWYTRTWTSPTDFTAPDTSSWHKLKIEITGTTAICYFDDQKLPDPQPDWTSSFPGRNSGKFGFGQYIDDAGTRSLYIDMFKAWSTGSAEPADPTPVPTPTPSPSPTPGTSAENWMYYE